MPPDRRLQKTIRIRADAWEALQAEAETHQYAVATWAAMILEHYVSDHTTALVVSASLETLYKSPEVS